MENKEVEVKKLQIMVEKNGHQYFFVFDDNRSIGELYDAAYEMLSRILDIAKEAAEKARPKDME